MTSQNNPKSVSMSREGNAPGNTFGDEVSNYACYDPSLTQIGITLNLPRVKTFTSSCASAQKKILRLVISTALSMIPKDFVCKYYLTYELCKDNNYHCHGIIYYKNDIAKSHNYVDFMSDFSKCLEKVINKTLKRKKDINNINPKYHAGWKRMYSIPFVLQYYDDPQTYQDWIVYIHKQQSK